MSNTIPASITPEAATWLRLQMTIAAGRAVEPLHAELQDLDGFINGLLVAVAQLVPVFLASDPVAAARLAPRWRHAAERYEALSAGEPPEPGDEPVAQLEARQVLYRACEEHSLWQRAATCSPRRNARRRLKQ